MARPPGFQSCGCGIRSGKAAARPAAMAQRGRRAAQEEQSCCAYNTGEDSTIKCTMTQFEDQFSAIKPDGIQVRCHKEYEI
uniref:Uncharacterized protein n=1 Tax=Oryza nivara TaxID=4536 RepID=A0A0E0ID74_ORYNI